MASKVKKTMRQIMMELKAHNFGAVPVHLGREFGTVTHNDSELFRLGWTLEERSPFRHWIDLRFVSGSISVSSWVTDVTSTYRYGMHAVIDFSNVPL